MIHAIKFVQFVLIRLVLTSFSKIRHMNYDKTADSTEDEISEKEKTGNGRGTRYRRK